MKKILITLLLLANLCSGLAFAWDTHPEAVVGHDSAEIDLIVGDDHDHPDGDLHHDDHCCHGASHLVGIVVNHSAQIVAGSHNNFIALSKSFKPLYITPFLRPPIV